MPFNRVHELYYYTYSIREEREKERKKEEEKRKKEAEAEEKKKNQSKKKPLVFDKRLSPAAQAKEANLIKSQRDERAKSEDTQFNKSELAPTSSIDPEDLIDVLEEGV